MSLKLNVKSVLTNVGKFTSNMRRFYEEYHE